MIRAQSRDDPYYQVNLLNNPAFVKKVESAVSRKISRKLTEQEFAILRASMSKLNPAVLPGNENDCVSLISQDFIKKLFSGKGRQRINPDIHEILALEAKRPEDGREIDPMRTNYTFSNANTAMMAAIEQKTRVKEQHIELDTRYRNVAGLQDNKTYNWGILYDSQRKKGIINIAGNKISNIISIQILPFRIPLPQTTTAVAYKQYRLLIREWQAQSCVSPSGKSYHFILRPTTDGSFIDLDPAGDKDQGGSFNFAKPIRRLDEITISITDPINDVVFYPDRFTCQITAYAAGTNFELGVTHNLLVGDTVTFEDFNTADPGADSNIINTINSSPFTITALIGATGFTIGALDTSVIPVGNRIAGLNFTCFPEARRFFIHMKIKYTGTEDPTPVA
jgi:hypothetical protein